MLAVSQVPCLLLLVINIGVNTVDAIGCFKCSSKNRDNPACEDTFNASSELYEADCWAGRKGRSGLFPGSSCIKLTMQDEETGETLMIRDCVVDNGGITSDTEISRTTHCGWVDKVLYQNKMKRGCVLTCYEDGCNTATHAQLCGALIVCFLAAWLL